MKLIFLFCWPLITILENYKQCFDNGLVAYNKEDYRGAVSNFSKSFVLKKHSKTLYYIAISYFKLGEDSLAEKFARQAQNEIPTLPDVPYQQNIQIIYNYYRIAPRFRKVRFKIEQSENRMTDKEKKEQDEIKKELEMYYSETPEGQRQLADDFRLVQSRSLESEGEMKLDTIKLKLYREPIIDSL